MHADASSRKVYHKEMLTCFRGAKLRTNAMSAKYATWRGLVGCGMDVFLPCGGTGMATKVSQQQQQSNTMNKSIHKKRAYWAGASGVESPCISKPDGPKFTHSHAVPSAIIVHNISWCVCAFFFQLASPGTTCIGTQSTTRFHPP